MQGAGAPSLDQLGVFLIVVEAGSFAAAGRRLGRATSAVSYAIAALEQQLGVQLFDRDQARRPALTEAGATVLAEARSISAGVDKLRAKVKGLRDGLEAKLRRSRWKPQVQRVLPLPLREVAGGFSAWPAPSPLSPAPAWTGPP